MDDIHIVFTEYPGQGWSFDSPQVRGLANFFSNAADARASVEDALLVAGVIPGTAKIHEHEQKFLTDEAGNEYLVRFSHSPESFNAAGRMAWSIGIGDITPQTMPANRAGDRLVIGASPADTLAWIDCQLRDDETATIVYHAGDDVVYEVPYARENGELVGHSFGDLDLALNSTIRQVVDAVRALEIGELAVHHAHAPEIKRNLVSA